jgi:hypothetical protein
VRWHFVIFGTNFFTRGGETCSIQVCYQNKISTTEISPPFLLSPPDWMNSSDRDGQGGVYELQQINEAKSSFQAGLKILTLASGGG